MVTIKRNYTIKKVNEIRRHSWVSGLLFGMSLITALYCIYGLVI